VVKGLREISAMSFNRIVLNYPEPTPVMAASNPGAMGRSQLNQACIQAFSDWVETEFDWVSQPFPNAATLPSIWEVVNGTAVILKSGTASLKVVLIPTIAIGLDELRVPQEWIDIPAWTADYYIALQIDPDLGCIELMGYSSHHDLKTIGLYDPIDRSYTLEIDDIGQDFNSVFISWELASLPITQATIAPLSSLPQAQAHNLIDRLGNPQLTFPRRAVPFSQWAALISHGGWRQQLCDIRQGRDSQSVQTWIRSGLFSAAQQWGWQPRECSLAGVRSLQSGIAKPLTIAGNPYELRVFPLGESAAWRFELRSATEALIPVGFKLRLLTEDLQMMDNNEDGALGESECLFVDVRLEAGEGLVWEVEPMPEGFDREILWF
jgi:Protein of unknown function (DUF1822)